MESKGFMQQQPPAPLPQTPPAIQIEPEAPPVLNTFQQHQPMSAPKTPQPQICSSPPPLEPPEPPKVRIKRRKPVLTIGSIPQLDSDCQEESSERNDPEWFLAPAVNAAPLVSCRPQAPLARLQTSLTNFHATLKTPEPWSAQSSFSKGESITRPSSTWSEISDSSASSLSSFGTFTTNDESCPSLDSEAVSDPFVSPEPKVGLMSSAIPREARSVRKRSRKPTQVYWSPEMDDYLWLTYMTYLSDPLVTPFKTLPGTAPPLGVCHRVARRAKKQWKGPRPLLGAVPETQTSFASLDDIVMERYSSEPRSSSPSTIRPSVIPRCSSAGARWNPNRWPHSGSATRKRLRELCKRKPTLSPHYQRLMHTRSPSPFESSSSQGPNMSSPRMTSDCSTFSTKDLHTTLATSTASTMQPGNVLSQLASSEPATPQRANPHMKSQSLQSTFGTIHEQQRREGLESVRRLASPFQEQPRRDTMPSSSQQPNLCPPELPVPQQRRLASPLEIQQPKPMSASMKRRAQYQLGEELLANDPELRRSFLEDIFRDPATASGKRRVRSRGFSLGVMRNASVTSRQPSTNLTDLFTPPGTEESSEMSLGGRQEYNQPALIRSEAVQPSPHIQLPRTPTLGDGVVRRLGSPFVPVGNVAQSNTFPRSLFPQGLDSISNLETQRQQQGQQRADVEMGNQFIGDASRNTKENDGM